MTGGFCSFNQIDKFRIAIQFIWSSNILIWNLTYCVFDNNLFMQYTKIFSILFIVLEKVSFYNNMLILLYIKMLKF